MDVTRLHFSYGDHDEHAGYIHRLRQASEKLGRRITILQDLGGAKVRMGKFKTDTVSLAPGDNYTLNSDDVEGDE